MRDQFLFVVAPYVAAFAFVAVCLARYVVRSGQPTDGRTEFTSGERGRLGTIWRWALGAVLLGHLALFVLPAAVLAWNQQPLRLFLLEGTGLLAGSLALFGLLATIVPALRAAAERGARPPADVIVGTLILIEVISGVAIAVLYRWASSWSEVTLEPYLRSLFGLEPSPILVTHLPFAVRLHVFCAFVVLAAIPFSRVGRLVIAPVEGLTRWTVAPVSKVLGPAWCAVEELSTKYVRTALAVLLPREEEEN